MFNRPIMGVTNNPLTESLYSQPSVEGSSNPPPGTGDFLLLDGTDFLLLNGTNFLLL